MHHKRKRSKSVLPGCPLCKANGCCVRHKDMRTGNRRRYEAGSEQLQCEEVRTRRQ